MEPIIDYATLRVIWWALVGVVLIGFAIMDGFDMGVAALLPFVAKGDGERRAVINTVGATWEGNQVWFIVGGAGLFAAWPLVYGASFSGFYLAMFLVLMALILRPVGFKYRSKRPGAAWRRNWDWALFVGGAAPALVFGVAIGNVLQGAPFSYDSDLRLTLHDHFLGGLLGLFSPFTILCGLTSVAMLGLRLKNEWLAFGGSSLGVIGIISTVGCSMFPIILPSTVDAHSSLLVWTASSSHMTLGIMLLVTLVFLPIVLFYTAWVYKVLFGRVGVGHLKTNPDLY